MALNGNTTDGEMPAKTFRHADRALIGAWVVSLSVHIALFAVMVAIPWLSGVVKQTSEREATLTDLRELSAESKITIVPLESSTVESHKTSITEQRISPEHQSTIRELDRRDKPQLSVIGIGTGGGDFAKYGLQVGAGQSGPEFFGLGRDARAGRRIVYVVDRSGSMLGFFEALQAELKRSISKLRKSQKYHVVFFSTDPPVESPPGRLVNAIKASKERTFEFIDEVVPEGMTQPIEAMRRAFILKPDLIYFLTDGNIPEGELLIENLKTWNRQKKTRIFCIAYVNPVGRELLEEIAREHNGEFSFVSENDLEN